MLYRTYHPFLLSSPPIYSFLSLPSAAAIATSYPSLFYFSLCFSVEVAVEMECVETAALKASLWRETNLKSSSQFCSDEQEIGSTAAQNGMGSDDFSVDELLDFSNEDGFIEEEREEEEEDEIGFSALSGSLKKTHQNSEISNPSTSFAVKDELSFPADDLADLEWLSNLVEDCFSEYSEPFPAAALTAKPLNQAETRLGLAIVPRPPFKTPVPAKARSKRTRTGGRVWSLGSPPLAESSSSSSTSSFSPPSPTTPHLFHKGDTAELFFPPEKKPKKKENGEGSQVPRRCSHCGVQKTPQWRTGPLGAKTLCNACGVRYKSGRLLPEYRPACSPTFSSEFHSNHHRKVLEMRRKKEVIVVRAAPNPGSTPPAVSTF